MNKESLMCTESVDKFIGGVDWYQGKKELHKNRNLLHITDLILTCSYTLNKAICFCRF